MIRKGYAAAVAKSLQSYPTLCDPIDSSQPGSPIHGILQATLEWVTISFSNAWRWKVTVKSLSHVQLFTTPWTAAYQAPLSMGFSGKSTGVGCHCLLLGSDYRSAKEATCQCWSWGSDPWVRKIPWRKKWQPTAVFLPEKSHGQRSLAGYSSWDHKRVTHDLVTKH